MCFPSYCVTHNNLMHKDNDNEYNLAPHENKSNFVPYHLLSFLWCPLRFLSPQETCISKLGKKYKYLYKSKGI